MRWWAPATSSVPLGDKYVIFSVDSGGANNVRLGLAMTALITQRLNRTLVLPPPVGMYLLDFGPRSKEAAQLPMGTKTRLEDFTDLKQLKAHLATLTWDEFIETNPYASLEAAQADAETVDPARYCDIEAYEALGESRIIFMNGNGREGFRCAEWWTTGQPRPDLKSYLRDEQWMPLLRDGLVWHEDAFKIASKVVNFFGMWKYAALHARYNDFQFKQSRQEEDTVLEVLRPLAKPGERLYVSSDEPERFQGLPGDVHIVTFADLVGSTGGEAAGLLNSTRDEYSPERWFKLKGMVEELICTYSKVFVGTARSTFSGHIQQMRIDRGAPVTRTLHHTDRPFPTDQVKLDMALWSAEHDIPL